MKPPVPSGALLVGALIALLAAPDGFTAATDLPVLDLAYTSANVLSVSAPNGDTFGATSAVRTVPPGSYVVTIEDDAYDGTDPVHMLHLAGPGVNLMTDLQGGDDKSEIYNETLAPNATYTFRDDDLPNLPAIVFTTSSTPAVSSTTPTSTGTTTTSATKPKSSKTSKNSDVVGSAKTTFRGTLEAMVGVHGSLSLTKARKRVTALKAGRYRFAVSDRSTTRGFFIEKIRTPFRTLSTPAFVGKRQTTVELGPGQWLFFSALTGRKTYFIVTA
ncbi:MAG TPA: hypothetical protein VH063_16975 [Gaiellaceae bacterium]|jgi:hypothetical protein|nr:hypothetical protein [Gaiellaceae bacterium]